MNTIKWKKGSHVEGNAAEIYASLDELPERTPDALAHASKDEKHPAHKAIWKEDDATAAWERRLQLSRKVLSSIEVIRADAPELPTRAFEVITLPATQDKPARKVYEHIEKVMCDPVQRDELLGNAIRDADAYRKRYYVLSELSKVFDAMDDFVKHAKAI